MDFAKVFGSFEGLLQSCLTGAFAKVSAWIMA